MPRIKLEPMLKKLKYEINKSIDLLNKLRIYAGQRRIPQVWVESVAELVFLRFFAVWENFLEETFIRYMCGGHAPSGYAPRLRTRCLTLANARDVLFRGRRYVQWGQVEGVYERARIYFENSEPYTSVLGTVDSHLKQMAKIRNRIAHISQASIKSYKGVVRDFYGYNPRRMTPGKLLTVVPVPPAALSGILSSSARTNLSLLNAYGQLLIRLGEEIVP